LILTRRGGSFDSDTKGWQSTEGQKDSILQAREDDGDRLPSIPIIAAADLAAAAGDAVQVLTERWRHTEDDGILTGTRKRRSPTRNIEYRHTSCNQKNFGGLDASTAIRIH
jgi:hypothetical protein